MNRYDRLIELIDKYKPQTIVEIGTWTGTSAIRMIQAASKYHNKIYYVGYDLFEEATPETDREEFNVKPHNNMADVQAYITKHCPFAEVALIKGNTRQTLTNIEADFVFIDGGHSLETIKHDYEAVKNSKIIVFDDFYTEDEDGFIPDLEKVGCNKLLEGIFHEVIPSKDPVKTGGIVNMAVVFGQ